MFQIVGVIVEVQTRRVRSLLAHFHLDYIQGYSGEALTEPSQQHLASRFHICCIRAFNIPCELLFTQPSIAHTQGKERNMPERARYHLVDSQGSANGPEDASAGSRRTWWWQSGPVDSCCCFFSLRTGIECSFRLFFRVNVYLLHAASVTHTSNCLSVVLHCSVSYWLHVSFWSLPRRGA